MSWMFRRGAVHSRLIAALIWPTTRVLSCAGTNPEKPRPYSGSSASRSSHFLVLKNANTSPMVQVLAFGQLPGLVAEVGETTVEVSQFPIPAWLTPYLRDGK